MDQNIEPKIETIETEEKNNKKNIIIPVIVGLIVVLIFLGIWYWLVQKKSVVPQEVTPTVAPSQPPAAVQPVPPKEDSVSAINQELNNLDIGNLDQEFQTIDADLNSL